MSTRSFQSLYFCCVRPLRHMPADAILGKIGSKTRASQGLCYNACCTVHILGHPRVPNLVVLVILGYQTWLFWSHSGTKPGCFGHSRVPNLAVLVILGRQTWSFWSHSGTKPGCCGHTKVPNLVVLVILVNIPEYLQRIIAH